jgi:hypothetical protein
VLKAHAEYYFGGFVAGADAEVRVYRKPFDFEFPRPKPYSWLSDSKPSRFFIPPIFLRNIGSMNSNSRPMLPVTCQLSLIQSRIYRPI